MLENILKKIVLQSFKMCRVEDPNGSMCSLSLLDEKL